MARLKKNATPQEVEAWNTKKAERMSKMRAKKEALKQKLAGLSEVKLQQYYDRQAKLKEGRDKWLAKWRGMSKLPKALYRYQKKTSRESKKTLRAEKKHRKEQKKKMFAARSQQRKYYPELNRRKKQEWKAVATTVPNKRNVAAKRREIYKNFKLVNWDDRKLKAYNRAAERRRHHYMMKTYDPQYKAVKKETKGQAKLTLV